MNVQAISIPGQQHHHGKPFPLVLECQTSAASLNATADWIAEHKRQLLQQAADHGAILFRGFPLNTAEDFDRFVAAFDLENFPYDQSLSNAVRVNKTPRVFTANEAPPSVTIFLHHEMAQTPVYPSRLFFFCEHAAAKGGATPLCRSDILWERLSAQCPQFAQNCASKGLRYSNVMPAENDATSGMGRSWQSTLRAATREAAEVRETVDSDFTVGYYPSLIYDGTTPVISYYDKSEHHLQMAEKPSSSWVPTTIDGSSDDTGRYSRLAVHPGTPRLAVVYADITTHEGKYRQLTGSTWSSAVVIDNTGEVNNDIAYTSLAFDGNNIPAVSFYETIDADLRFAYAANSDGTAWSAARIGSSSGVWGLNTNLHFSGFSSNTGRALWDIVYYNKTNGSVDMAQGNLVDLWTYTIDLTGRHDGGANVTAVWRGSTLTFVYTVSDASRMLFYN
jgi:hypothetical protein